jgi:hypothetical protein
VSVPKKSFLVMSPRQRFLFENLDRVKEMVRRLPSSPEDVAKAIAGIERFERDGKVGELLDLNGMVMIRLILPEDL